MIDGILVFYLLLGAVAAGVGTIMCAAVHGMKKTVPEAVDFAGKCLAIAGQTLAVLAAVVRFGPEAGVYTPLFLTFSAVAVIVLLTVGLVFYGFKIADLTAKSKSKPQPQPQPQPQPRPLTWRDLGVMGLTTVAVAAVIGLVGSRRP